MKLFFWLTLPVCIFGIFKSSNLDDISDTMAFGFLAIINCFYILIEEIGELKKTKGR